MGSVFEWKGLSRKQGVVIEGGQVPIVLFSNGKATQVTREKLGRARRILDLSSIPSSAYRLQIVSERSEKWAQSLKTWIDAQGGVVALLTSDAEHRLYARSAIAAGRLLPVNSALSPTEIKWLFMHARSADGAHRAAAVAALELPSDRYEDKVEVLLRAVVHDGWTPDAQQVAAINDIPADFAGVALLRAGIGLESDVSRLLDSVANLGASDEDLERLAWLSTADHQRATAPRSVVPITAEEKLLSAGAGARIQMTAAELSHLQATNGSVLDDVIDHNLVMMSGSAGEFTLEQRGRLDPISLTADDLSTLGHEWEIARRAYVEGKTSDDGLERATPSSHYRALAYLRNGDTSRVNDLVDPSGVLAAVAESLDTGTVTRGAVEDPSAWPVLGDLLQPGDFEGSALIGEWLVARAMRRLLDWRFTSASEDAREALRLAEDEATRDEALNLIAFHHYQDGRDEAAIAALEKALAGEYTASLQANAGIVAEQMDPESASRHLGRLASEAPTNELKLAAVRRAFHVWNKSRPAWEDDEDADDEVAIPSDLLGAMRSLVTGETAIEDHREMMRLLANFDAEWVANEANTAGSPHVDSWEHRVYVARAQHDPQIYIDTLASALKARPADDWLLGERDGLVNGLRDLIFADIEHIGPAAYAYAAIDAGLPMEPVDQVALTCGAFYGICRSFAADENEPNDEVYGQYLHAKGLVSKLEDDQREALGPLVVAAGNSYAMCVGVAREARLQEGAKFLDRVAFQLAGVPIRRINWTAVRDGLRPLREMCNDSINALTKAKGVASDEELIAGLTELISQFQTFSGLATNPRKAFT